MNFTIIYSKEKDGGYTTQVVELPGCISYGTDIEDAKQMTQEAIVAYLESVKNHQEFQKNYDSTFISNIFIDDHVYA